MADHPPKDQPASPLNRGLGSLPGHLALVFVQLCFGLLPLFVKRLNAGGVSPRGVVSWRIAAGALVFFGLGLFFHRRDLRVPRRDLLVLAICALLGVVLNQVLALEGIVRSSSLEAGLIMTLIPVFTFALAALVGQERFELRRALGIPVALGGALLLLIEPSGGAGLQNSHAFGNFLMACNCASYAGFLVLSRRVLRRMPPLVLTAWVYLFAALSLTILVPGEPLIPTGEPATVSQAWWALGFVIAFPTLAAYGLNTFALSRLPASITAIYIYLQPLIAGLAGVLLLNEVPRPVLPLAAALLAVGIALVTIQRRPRAAD